MSATRHIVFGVSIVWLVRAVAIASGLLLLPVFMRVLNREELGTWMVLGSSQSFLALLNFGVPLTLTRHIALAKGRSGADPDVQLTPETQEHIADLVTTGRTILRGLAVFSFLFAFPIGLAFLWSHDFQEVSLQRVVWAWAVLCAGYGVGVWVSYLECWISGIGYVGRSNVVIAAIAVVTLCANIAAALLGGGIVALATIFVVAGLLQRVALRYALNLAIPSHQRPTGHWNRRYAENLIRPSLHAWVYTLGYFLAMQGGAYFIMQVLGAGDVPPYQSAYTLLTNLQMLAGSFAVTSSVFLSQAWQAGDQNAVRVHTIRFAQMGLAIMAVGVAFLLTAGREFIELWLGPNSFVGYRVLAVMCLAYTIQIHSVILATCARATEDERYALSAVTAGILNLALCWLLIGRWGILGVAASLLIAEVVSNGWYCVARPLARLQIPLGHYLRNVFLLGVVTFLLSFLISDLLVEGLRTAGSNRFGIVLAAAVSTACVFGAAVWWGVFDNNHRRRVIHRVRRVW